ncbi:MAG: holo-ACP synthase [Bacilli bacterium]
MILGMGIDAVDINRISKLAQHNDRFVKRILTEEELSLYNAHNEKRKVEFLSGRYAAKEAFSKAIGTGIGKHFSFHDVSVMRNSLGAPYILLHNKDLDVKEDNIHISITHTDEIAFAQIIISK